MRWVAFALVVACGNPSRLDEVPTVEPNPWGHLAIAARTLDPARGHLLAACNHHLDDAYRISELEAWAEAAGRIPEIDDEADDPFVNVGVTGLVAARAGAHDDRALEAFLYLAQQLRRDQSNYLDALQSLAILHKVIQLHPHPPAFATRYAPTDDEVFHSLAGEAIWVRVRDPEQANTWRWLADAPRDRKGLLALLLRRAVLEPDPMSEITLIYAIKMYSAVDDYQHWLAR